MFRTSSKSCPGRRLGQPNLSTAEVGAPSSAVTYLSRQGAGWIVSVATKGRLEGAYSSVQSAVST